MYEDQIESVAVGQTVRATVDGLPGQTFAGTVSFVYPHVDHMTRTAVVRTVLENPRHALRPGMYATTEIVTPPVADAIVVPREAVIDTGTRQIAFVVDPKLPGHFEPRNVRRGISGDDDRVQILAGLAPGERVVTSGQFLMDVESRTAEAIEKLRGGGEQMAAETATQIDRPMGATPMASTATTTGPAADLRVAHCPMKDADWLQAGDAIDNPVLRHRYVDLRQRGAGGDAAAAGVAVGPGRRCLPPGCRWAGRRSAGRRRRRGAAASGGFRAGRAAVGRPASGRGDRDRRPGPPSPPWEPRSFPLLPAVPVGGAS